MKPSTALVLKGALGLVVGVIAVAWPGVTVEVLVIVFALYAFIAAALEDARVFASDSFALRSGYLVLATLDAIAGVAALGWQGITAVALVELIAAWSVATGLVELFLAFSVRDAAGHRAVLGMTGAISVALGLVLAMRPDIGALTIAEVYGQYSIVGGLAALVAAADLKRARAAMTSARRGGAPNYVVGGSCRRRLAAAASRSEPKGQWW